jgi:hypothetical protein
VGKDCGCREREREKRGLFLEFCFSFETVSCLFCVCVCVCVWLEEESSSSRIRSVGKKKVCPRKKNTVWDCVARMCMCWRGESRGESSVVFVCVLK